MDRRNPGPTSSRRWPAGWRIASLIVFPEGTRSVDGAVGRFKKGPFVVAIDARLPVVPVSLAGNRHVMKKGRLMVRPGQCRGDDPCADSYSPASTRRRHCLRRQVRGGVADRRSRPRRGAIIALLHSGPDMHVTAIIAAGGAGRRLGAGVPKQLLELGGRSILQHSVPAFAGHPDVAS